jgi:hypothetical protein
MPTPVSLTETSTDPSFSNAPTSIRPPSGVNLIAFDKRFRRTCLTFRSSPRISPQRWSTECSSVIPRRPARSRTSVRALSMACGRWKSVSSSSMRPASILDKSRSRPQAWMRQRGPDEALGGSVDARPRERRPERETQVGDLVQDVHRVPWHPRDAAAVLRRSRADSHAQTSMKRHIARTSWYPAFQFPAFVGFRRTPRSSVLHAQMPSRNRW